MRELTPPATLFFHVLSMRWLLESFIYSEIIKYAKLLVEKMMYWF